MSTIEAEMTTKEAPKKKRRATAETMAKSQREISVSEFFAKNRHLLGFDNPRKALLTTIKEAVDNSLDACEEAGIVPEIWVHVEQTGTNRYKAGIQDNGPGILKKQIPLIFGKLLYGSKFHRLRMSRGQQGIGISAAGMYGLLTTGKPVKIVSKVSIRRPAHYYELRINTKTNDPEILNNKGDGVDIPAGEAGHKYIAKQGIEWVTHYPKDAPEYPGKELSSGTRVTIELEAKYQRGRGSVDEYLEQTAIANPHVTIRYLDPENNLRTYNRSTRQLPPEPIEIKPHPYGVEVGRLITMLKDTSETTISGFLTNSFSRVSNGIAKQICKGADIGTRTHAKKLNRDEIEKLYHSIQDTKISNPSTECIVPIGEDLLLKGMHQVVPAEFYCAATRPPAVYRGNPFLIEVALAYGGSVETTKITKDLLKELLSESDARTVRQFLINTFNGLGADAADRITKSSKLGARKSPGKLKPREIDVLFDAMQNININEGQSMNVLRYANRVPLQFQHGACAITQSITGMNWRSYGLTQSRGNLPSGPVTVMVHMASVWVPFTSESKEAVASYPEIQKELRLALQAVGRKLGMFLRKRQLVKQQADRRSIFLRYLGEVATAVSEINGSDRQTVYDNLMAVAQKKTAEADMKLTESGKLVEENEVFGDNVLIVEKTTEDLLNRPSANGAAVEDAVEETAEE
ncbi:DNA topoisomerase VI subunit B [Blastopirellula retiformator]|uniref:Type 2 DNA topoisomerase 6 subunit B n=1 Tax=Blastopirellula retiformator TaxID=2527970 RepID=A0A5C5V2Z3_9BACT|nr:DNA topoisomerase VI subunit B [Blastopirellula retiformator]TWT32751.1 DNA topoisomerase VI subunit B [Blastopirellula retiformator]